MNLTIQNSEADSLLQEIYTILKEPRILELSDRERLEQRLKKVIDLRWVDNNLFESYFIELNTVLGAMSQMDFTKRMTETDDPESLLNLIATSFNRINERMEKNYVGIDFVPELMDSVRVQNRIVIVSSDKETINRAFTSLEDVELNLKGLRNIELTNVISKKVLDFLTVEEDSYYEYSGELAEDFLPELEDRKVHFSIRNGKRLVITITFYPDNVLEENKDRMLQLIRGLNRHFDKHPETVKSILGLAYSLELKSIVNELLPYIDAKFPVQTKPSH